MMSKSSCTRPPPPSKTTFPSPGWVHRNRGRVCKKQVSLSQHTSGQNLGHIQPLLMALSVLIFFIYFQTQRLHESGLLKEADLVRLNALQRSEEVRPKHNHYYCLFAFLYMSSVFSFSSGEYLRAKMTSSFLHLYSKMREW